MCHRSKKPTQGHTRPPALNMVLRAQKLRQNSDGSPKSMKKWYEPMQTKPEVFNQYVLRSYGIDGI